MATKRKDGRYQTSFTKNGKRYYVYAKSLKELAKKEADKREEVKNQYSRRNDPTVGQYYEKWIKRKEKTIKPITYRGYLKAYKRVSNIYIPEQNKLLKDIKLRNLEADDLIYVQQELSKHYSVKTTNDYMSHLGDCLKSAEKENKFIGHYNPYNAVNWLRNTEEPARNTYHRALSREETELFFSCKLCEKSAYYNVFRFALCTGMRAGEIGALKYSDIHDGFINVCRTVTKGELGELVIGVDAKTKAGQRKIPINAQLQEVIDYQKELNKTLYGEPKSDDELLFKSPEGKIMNSTPLARHTRKICEACGIEPFTMHAFRATFATRCVENGMNLKTLQEILGHTNFNLTMSLYAHCMDETKIKEMKDIRFDI